MQIHHFQYQIHHFSHKRDKSERLRVSPVIVYRAGYFGFYDAGKQVFFDDGGANTSIFLRFEKEFHHF